MTNHLSRRQFLAMSGAAVATALTHGALAADNATTAFRYCLNTSTISGQKLTLVQQIDTVAKAGYQCIEPWVRDIDAYVKTGGALADVKKRIADAGLTVEDGIGFASWIVDNDAQRAKALEQAKHDMDMLSQIGGKRMAAPPIGATDRADMDIKKIAERYRVLYEMGQTMGITPQVEIWGHSKCLSQVDEAAAVITESGCKNGCILADVYHMYKGNCPFSSLAKLPGSMLQVLHMNDYPAQPPRATINDSFRVYPGDGIAPLPTILADVRKVNPACILSLELFNREYWKQDALEVAKTGLEKMKAIVAKL